uniref:Uncharacterized protein n=1 Tax=Graphocephala atropunctata TaxID=36148 RepID=A0A1B6MHH9_9HEMI
MVQVWHSALASQISDIISIPEDGSQCEESLSISGSESTCEVKPNGANSPPGLPNVQQVKVSPSKPDDAVPLSRATVLLVISTTLLIALFLSAAVLMYRLSLLQHSFGSRGSRSLFEVQEFLDMNLNNLYKVRQSLETLSLMLENEKEKTALKEVERHDSETTPTTAESELPQSQQRKTEELLAS